jgi:excisionase family DNA binding protein
VNDRQFDVSALDELFADLPARMTAEQVGEVLGVTPHTVRRLIQEDDPDPLPAYQVGRSWMVLRDEFKGWLLRHRSNPNV